MKQIRQKNQPPEKDLATSPPVTSDDDMFREAMADVREIKEFTGIPYESPCHVGFKPRREPDCREVLRRVVAGEEKIVISLTGEYVEWLCPDARRDLPLRLHNGEFAVQDCIDLHGMTVVEAETAFTEFVADAVRRRLTCVKVIHGRGLRSPRGPILKHHVGKWLRGTLRRSIAAFASAKDTDGGLGATYLVLRRRR